MPKLRKLRKKQKFKTTINRKRLNLKTKKKKNITCEPITNNWENHKSVRRNMREMGLVYNPNENFHTSNVKQQAADALLSSTSKEDVNVPRKSKKQKVPVKVEVCQKLEEISKQKREKMFRLPKSQVEYLSYFLDLYDLNYKRMTLDKRNVYQETWKQFRVKIRKLMKIPDQFGQYIQHRREKGLKELNLDNEYDTDDE